ncbi:lysophosphatidic acid receptor 6-like [Astatotilapia calliptera]|uniref:lysophosphatidic acid receptor 6-like n=1 Tax=Astatotilapia calliptera TaxID=8154 RepID=UPI000E412772|nr:lysophosphatidic acid receptor 6-like [Astatotilapia calliptera]
MNTSNSSTEDDRVYAGIFGCIMVIGLPLNAVSLWILLRRHSLKSPNAVFMVNLALSDLLAIFSLPMRIYHHATGTPLGIITCLFSVIIFRNNIRSSASFITFISVDRLLAVVYPLRSRHLRTSCNAWKGAALVWGVLLVVNIPEAKGFLEHLQNHTDHICFELHEYKSVTRSAIIYLQIVLLVTMLAVNIVCTVMVSWTLHKHLSDSAKDIRTKLSGRVTTLPSLGRRPKPLHSAGMKLVSMLRNNPETTKVQLWHEQESAVILGPMSSEFYFMVN